MASPDDMLNVARGEIGYSRWTDPQSGTKYGRWYADLTGDSYYGSSGVPYCAMFVSYCFAQAGATAPGLPGSYCPWIVSAARQAGSARGAREAQAGDVVLFDWDGDGVSDHVGIVESNTGSSLTTIEGNTNNGEVRRRSRAYSTVICINRPNWTKEEDMPLNDNDINRINDLIQSAIGSVNSKVDEQSLAIGARFDTQLTATNTVGQQVTEQVESALSRVRLTIPHTISGNEMYRLFNPYSDQHLWTSSASERDALIALGWTDEGEAWTMPEAILLHRLYNPYTKDYMYTTDVDEANDLASSGWIYEDVAGVAAESGTPVHRLYNPDTNMHHFTADQNEVSAMVASGWTDEGVKFYAN